MKLKVNIKILLIVSMCVLSALQLDAQEAEGSSGGRSRATRLERRGDNAFVTSRYDNAVELYKRAAQRVEGRDESEWLRMQLKLARVYNMLQDYENAVLHYRTLLDYRMDILGVEDVCIYLDALRSLGRIQEAEIAARSFAFMSPYSRNQRYINTVNALGNLQYSYAAGDSEYAVRLLESSGPMAEYWLYEWDGQMFCAVSDSPVMDPRKVFFHRTRFSIISDDGKMGNMKTMPILVQDGPAANHGDMWILTSINYDASDRIHGVGIQEMFRTRLYYTVFDGQRSRWSTPALLFEQQADASYAHPALVDEGRTLIFSSDMAGGYGGMDLYMSKWDESTEQWSKPVNLGPIVNTEGDEIFPMVSGSTLYFSSNGHEGYGGFDIYGVSFVDSEIVSVPFHHPYPVNSVYNDYGLYQKDNRGYFISDRRGRDYRDDIYTFRSWNAQTSVSGPEAYGMSHEYLALNGNLNEVVGLSNEVPVTRNIAPAETRLIRVPEPGDIVYSVYFDFDQWRLTPEAVAGLDSLLRNRAVARVEELFIYGYADEMGTDYYNMNLSERRAETVARYLITNGVKPRVTWEGRGRTTPDMEDFQRQLSELWDRASYLDVNVEIPQSGDLPVSEQIKLNRTARRVDIIVRKK